MGVGIKQSCSPRNIEGCYLFNYFLNLLQYFFCTFIYILPFYSLLCLEEYERRTNMWRDSAQGKARGDFSLIYRKYVCFVHAMMDVGSFCFASLFWLFIIYLVIICCIYVRHLQSWVTTSQRNTMDLFLTHLNYSVSKFPKGIESGANPLCLW